MLFVYILLGKTIILISRLINFGNGSTWPGHIILKLYPNFLKEITKNSKLKVVFVTGTNGKTTTTTMIATILKGNGKTVFQNTSGANLKNGIASSFIRHSNLRGIINDEYAVIEVDENNLPTVLTDLTPHSILILNLFRDQLDRYQELDSIATKWNLAFKNLTPQTTLILNADDPLIVSLGKNTNARVYFFGLNDETINQTHQHASDSTYCPLCKTKLIYTRIYYSHLGHWQCPNCKFTRPQPDLSNISCPLPGTYNKYNALAAGLFILKQNINQHDMEKIMKNITAVFGRQEKIEYKGKNIKIFLSKNPTSFNQSLVTIFSDSTHKNYNLLVVLNDAIPDGRDISWIWDIDFEEYIGKCSNVTISGHRVYDIALRLQYAQQKYQGLNSKYQVESNLKRALQDSLEKTSPGETLYILPTYSAMLEIRKILTGRKIL